jgi:hypothetical protein
METTVITRCLGYKETGECNGKETVDERSSNSHCCSRRCGGFLWNRKCKSIVGGNSQKLSVQKIIAAGAHLKVVIYFETDSVAAKIVQEVGVRRLGTCQEAGFFNI